MKNKRRIAVLAAVLALVMLSSVLFLVLEAGHDCPGEDCAVCAQICACLERLEQLTPILCALLAAALLRRAGARLHEAASGLGRRFSLISLKVKLSD